MRLRWLTSLAALASMLLPPTGAHAQAPVRGLTPVPYNASSPVTLDVSLNQKEPRIGSMVSICFQASRAGFATLWNISTANQVARVFPNQFVQIGQAAPVEADKRYCAGTDNDPFRFRVDGPAGTEDLYLLWTTRPDLQPSAATYADATALVQDMQRLGGASSSEWGTTKITYDIVPAAGPQPPVVPTPPVNGAIVPPPLPPATAPAQTTQAPPAPTPSPQPPDQSAAASTSQVWIFAMGANVDQLTKTNQDAALFTKTTTALFNVPADHVRLLENGTNADFVAGLAWLTAQAQPSDFVFIYFSGHGGRFKSPTSDDGWDEFLVPYDFQTPNADVKNLLFSQRIAALINRLHTKNVVAVIDACNSAGVYRSLEAGVLGARSKFFPLTDDQSRDALAAFTAEMPPPTRAAGGRNRLKANGLLLAAAHRDQSALESSRGGFFTVALVQEMVSKQGGSLDDVFDRAVKVTEELSKNRQNPEAVGDRAVGQNITFD